MTHSVKHVIFPLTRLKCYLRKVWRERPSVTFVPVVNGAQTVIVLPGQLVMQCDLPRLGHLDALSRP